MFLWTLGFEQLTDEQMQLIASDSLRGNLICTVGYPRSVWATQFPGLNLWDAEALNKMAGEEMWGICEDPKGNGVHSLYGVNGFRCLCTGHMLILTRAQYESIRDRMMAIERAMDPDFDKKQAEKGGLR